LTVGKIDISRTLKNVEDLLREDKTSSPQIRAMMELLIVVINLLLNKLGLNSSNSSTPPSKDPNRPRGSKRNVPGEKLKPGGQNGHPGTTLKKVGNPDQITTLIVDRKTIPEAIYTQVGFESRQVIDIEISTKITEFRAEILQDSKGNKFVAKFPDGITQPIQYGASVKAQSVYLSQQQLLPYDRIRDYFTDQCKIPISAGSLFNFNKEAYRLLENFERLVKCGLIDQKLLNADETGININGKIFWLHTVGNDKLTLFYPHAKRGHEAMDAIGVLNNFHGVLCHDHWKPYFKYSCLHALCNAHHLRELERAWEHDKQNWAKKMQSFLLEINEAVNKAGGSLSEADAIVMVTRYRTILEKAEKECPAAAAKPGSKKRGRIAQSKSRNLLVRLRDFEIETLRFMTNKLVPFTNNQGENDIRMTKVQQKISGCFRSFEGAMIFCRVRSYLSTCRKNSIAPTEALQLLFAGKLPQFILDLE
jgi:transposase